MPLKDGDIKPYHPGNAPGRKSPMFYYVNGIMTDETTHIATCELLAGITESVVYGVYNQSDKFGNDFMQCIGDWVYIFRNQLREEGFWQDRLAQSFIGKLKYMNPFASDYLNLLREVHLAPSDIKAKAKSLEKLQKVLSRNPSTLKLFDRLRKNSDRKQIVIAHSQGNLITSSALWALQAYAGSNALRNIEVRSISSPAPAWPRGINHKIKVYGQKDDLVTLADPKNWTFNRSEGFWDVYFFKNPERLKKPNLGTPIEPHDVGYNIANTSLAQRLKLDAGLK